MFEYEIIRSNSNPKIARLIVSNNPKETLKVGSVLGLLTYLKDNNIYKCKMLACELEFVGSMSKETCRLKAASWEGSYKTYNTVKSFRGVNYNIVYTIYEVESFIEMEKRYGHIFE